MKFRKKPVVIEATRWFTNGDHPEDGTERFVDGDFRGKLYEGKVVRYFRHPDVPVTTRCRHCSRVMHVHGWIETLEGGHNVCPGDWIITGVAGERYPCKPDIFEKTYEKVADPLYPKKIEEMTPAKWNEKHRGHPMRKFMASDPATIVHGAQCQPCGDVYLGFPSDAWAMEESPVEPPIELLKESEGG